MTRILGTSLGLAVWLLALAVPAMASPRDDVLYGISRCGGIADDRTWLDCVYGAAQPMRAQLALPPAPAAQQKLVPPPMPGMAAPPAQSFGATAAAPAAPAYTPNFFDRVVDNLTKSTDYKPEPPTTLASYKFDAAGFFTITLANGETWKQNGGDSAMAHWNGPAKSYTAQILADAPRDSHLKVGPETFMVVRQ